MASAVESDRYLHWDELRHRPPPQGLSHEQWWLAEKLCRRPTPLPLLASDHQPFWFSQPPVLLQGLHQIDMQAGINAVAPQGVTSRSSRDRYLLSSLMEEAITSSQMEGAATTRDVAKAMIRSRRPPRDRSERMILNNFLTMQRIRELREQPLTPELVLDLHRLVSEDTLDDPGDAGRLRPPGKEVVVDDTYGTVFHVPPAAEELPGRLEELCRFANGETPKVFIHPVVRAIALHFWLAYDHPFCDGNGRTARALFYWAMLHQGYWLFEFISISSVINKARGQYERSFLFSESDDNDLTYFLLAQVKVIQQAITSLHAYLERKAGEVGGGPATATGGDGRAEPSPAGAAAPCPEPFRLPLFGALAPEQPWREPSDRPQRSAEAGDPWTADGGQGWAAGGVSGARGSGGAAAGLISRPISSSHARWPQLCCHKSRDRGLCSLPQ